jgi:hypothetical protein
MLIPLHFAPLALKTQDPGTGVGSAPQADSAVPTLAVSLLHFHQKE